MNDEIIVLCMNNCRSWMSLSKSCCVWHVDWLNLLVKHWNYQDGGYAHHIEKWFKNHLLLVSQHSCDCSISVAK